MLNYKSQKTALLAAVAVMMGAVAATADPIRVNVNGTPVNFSGMTPMQTNGSVLVPLRGVFEAMGASVSYNADSKTINATKGSSYVVLPLGSTSATVNGVTQTLSQPARAVNGTTLVPLRFVAQALGANVDWQAASSTVQIQTQDPHLATLPSPPGTGPVTGQVTGIVTNANPPLITLRINGQNTAVPLNSSTLILRSAPGEPGVQSPLSEIRPGDQVTVQRSGDGSAQSIVANYGQYKGTVKSIGRLADGSNVITLNDGTTVQLAQDAPVTMNGRTITLKEIMPDEKVLIRTNPSSALGYAVVVNPERGQNTPVGDNNLPPNAGFPGGIAPQITAFQHNAVHRVRGNGAIHIEMRGTPGGKASFDIPGVASNIPLTEASPGRYAGDYKVPADIAVEGAAVIGKLTVGNQTAPLLQANQTLSVDSSAPKIGAFSPARSATVENDRPLIYATLNDASGTGVDPNSVKVSLDGKDVTAEATITPSFFNFTPAQPLAAGAHEVRVHVADQAGNVQSAAWPFVVSSERLITHFDSTVPDGRAVEAGSKLQFKLAAKPGGRASFSIGSLAKDIPMTESTPGVYVGSYTVARGDNLSDAPVTAKFVDGAGRTVTKALAKSIDIAAGAPVTPTITTPAEGGDVPTNMTVSGKASPNSIVRVKVDYTSKALGGLFGVNGSAGTKDVTADANGNWTASDLTLQTNSLFTRDRDTTFTVSATSVNAKGDESEPAVITVQGGKAFAHRAN
ncbi:MAG: copper amine oxidase-like protein [Capsulimonas sp.]|nr:copper amine oxidase-like protein [Capsulimonas sp.]